MAYILASLAHHFGCLNTLNRIHLPGHNDGLLDLGSGEHGRVSCLEGYVASVENGSEKGCTESGEGLYVKDLSRSRHQYCSSADCADDFVDGGSCCPGV